MLRRRKFFQGRRIRGADVLDIAWFDPSGAEMTDETWNSPHVRCLGVRLNGDAIDELDERGERIVDDTLLMLLNGGPRHSLHAAAGAADRTLGDAARHRDPRAAAPPPGRRALPTAGSIGGRAPSGRATGKIEDATKGTRWAI